MHNQSGWINSTIEDVAEAVSTGPFGSLLHKHDYITGGIPVINPVNLVNGLIQHNEDVTVSEETAKRLSAYCLRPGDILVGRRGDIGRCALVSDSNDGSLCGTGCFFIRPSQAVEPQFLALLLGSPEYRTKLQAASTGTTMLNLSNSTLSRLVIWVPPLDEQKRIVAVLDQAFAALDRARAHAEANLADADELLEASKSEVIEHSRLKGKLVSLADVTSIDSTLVDPRQPEFFDMRHIGAGNMVSGTDALVDVMTARQEGLKSGKYLFDDTMVLYSKIRPYLRKVARPDFTGVCSADVYPLSPSPELDRDFLFHVLHTKDFTEYAISGSGRAGMPKVNREHLFKYEFWLPPLAAQLEAASKIDLVMEATGRLKASLTLKLSQIANLRQSLLQKAFSGQLT